VTSSCFPRRTLFNSPYLREGGRRLQVFWQDESKATQNATQHLHVSARTGLQGTSPADEETLVLPVHAPQCTNVLDGLVGDTGLEPGPSSSRVTHFLEDGNATSDALTVDDPQLQLLIERWPTVFGKIATFAPSFIASCGEPA
jgi:hypothetical protein